MNKPIFCLILFSLSFILACSNHGDFVHRLQVADTLMRRDADSAFRMLSAMNKEAEQMPENLRMQHLLLRCNAQNKADSLFHDDSLGCLLTQYFDRKGTPNQRMLAYYIKGCAYRDLGLDSATLETFNQAVSAADTSDTDCDLYQLGIIYGQLGGLFNDYGLYHNALQAFNQAEAYARQLNDTLWLLNIWNNKAEALFFLPNKFKEGMRYKEKAIKTYLQLGNIRLASIVKGDCIKWYARLKQHEKAKAYMDDYEKHSGFFLKNGDIEHGREDYYHIKGIYYLEQEIMDSAEHYLRKLMSTGRANSKYLAASGLKELYKRLNNVDSVAKYADLGDNLNNVVYNQLTANNFLRSNNKYEELRRRKALNNDNLAIRTTQKEIKLLVATSGTIVGLLIIFIVIYYRYNQKKDEEIKVTFRQEKEKMDVIIHDRETQMNLLKEKEKESDLMLQKLEQGLSQMKEEYKEMEDTVKLLQRTTSLSQLKNLPAINRIIKRAEKQQETPSIDEWMALRAAMEKEVPQLGELMQNGKLSVKEYRICLLTLLQFPLPHICFLLDILSPHLSTIRKRLLKKLFNKDGGAKEFDKYLHEWFLQTVSDNEQNR